MQGIAIDMPPGLYVLLYSGGLDSSYLLSRLLKRDEVEVVALHGLIDRRLLSIVVANAARVAEGKPVELYISNHYMLLRRAVAKLRELHALDYTCIACKALLMLEASRLAVELGANGVVTGETLGQVASQTLPNMLLIHSYSRVPVYTPLLALDKHEAGNIVAQRVEKTPPCPFLPKRRVTRPDPILARMVIDEAIGGLEDLIVFEKVIV